MLVHEPEDISVAYQDNSQCWTYFKQLSASLFPIKDIKFNFDIGEFSLKNFRPSFYPENDSFFADSDSPIKVYKRPYVYLSLITFASIQEYLALLKPQIEAFVNRHEKKPDGEEPDEWLIIYTTPKQISSEIEYVKLLSLVFWLIYII